MSLRLAPPPLRSTPLRLAGILILVFSVAILAGFGGAFWVVRVQLGRDLEQQLAQSLAAYTAIARVNELEERLAEDVTAADPRRTVIVFTRSDGSRISNVPAFPDLRGTRILREGELDGIDLGEGAADSYLVSSADVPGGRVLLAKGREQIAELREIFSSVLLISFVPALVIATGIGFWAARRAQNRVEAIHGALTQMTAGRLHARVPDMGGAADDLAQIGLAVNEMAGSLAASMESLRQVSADIAHDLKTPIQRVSVLLEELDQGRDLSPAAREVVRRARDETDQIVRTFQALLRIAQLEGGGARQRFAPVDLSRLADGMAEVYAPSAEDTGHRLTVELDAAPAVVQGERDLLGQVIANLIENALRHTPAGSGIVVTVAHRDDAVLLSVCDDGPGVPEDERENVLRRLYRLERSRTSEGSGLGLSLVAAIADLHGADLVLSDNRPGLCVTLHFRGGTGG
jgi:signal transduction histidine kinase